MKKVLKILIPLLIIGGIIFYVFREIKPIDDTKKLYIECNKNSDNYDVISGNKLKFSKEKDACYLDIKVMNVDKDYLKLSVSKFLYSLDGNGKIDEDAISKNVIIIVNEPLVQYTYDKKTKFTFEYK